MAVKGELRCVAAALRYGEEGNTCGADGQAPCPAGRTQKIGLEGVKPESAYRCHPRILGYE